MSELQAAVLGALQGLGEFLPISSSGHLIVVPWLVGWEVQPLAFDVALHLGTLVAVLYAFLAEWLRLGASGLRCLLRGRPLAEPEARRVWRLLAASTPAAVAGLLLDRWAETVFRAPLLVAFSMSLMGAVLLLADRRAGGGRAEDVTLKHAMIIGCAQALALVPGVSRSGATISAALLLGYGRAEAARFSFLLATPIIAGAAALKVPRLLAAGAGGALWIGMASAALFGLLGIRLLLGYVRTKDYRPFAYYRFAFSALVVAVFGLRAFLR